MLCVSIYILDFKSGGKPHEICGKSNFSTLISKSVSKMHLEESSSVRGQDKKESYFPVVGTGFKRTKFQNNQVTINYSRKSNTECFEILTAILKNVMHSV
jgi:uncharacterized protein (DUF608 family)